MENFKIENFLSSNPNSHFPVFDKVVKDKLESIQIKICRTFNFEEMSIDLLKEIRNQSSYIGNHEESLSSLLNKNGVTPLESIFLNWHRYDEIDQMSFLDLNNYFDDIWYPSTDDIDVFDESLSWILSVDHDGSVYLWNK